MNFKFDIPRQVLLY